MARLQRRLEKLEPLFREQQIKQHVAQLYQVEVAEALLKLYHGLPAEKYAEAEGVFLEHLHEVLEAAYGRSWQRHLHLSPRGEA